MKVFQRRALGSLVSLGVVLGVPAMAASCSSSSSSGPDDPPPTLDRQALLNPESCKKCHVNHYEQWSGSMHAYASEDPVFRAMNAKGQRETKGQLGDFCVKCHAPMAVRENATKDGLNLDTVDKSLHGVTCYFCHSADKIEGTHNAQLGLSQDLVMRGSFEDPVKNTAHRSGFSVLHHRDRIESSDLCGSCHDIETGHGAKIERTYIEWKESIFSQPPIGATCGQCHMPQSTNKEPIAQYDGVFQRRTHDHSMVGVDVALTPFPHKKEQREQIDSFLSTTLQSAICVSTAAGGAVRIILDNVGVGHHFPSGSSQDRRLWTEVVAYRGGRKIYESGVVADNVPATKNPDPDMWMMRDCIFDPAGVETHNFWEAASYEGNAMPGKLTFNPLDKRYYQTHVMQKYPRTGGILPEVPDKVTLRVRLRPMDVDVLEDLVNDKDKLLDPAVLKAVPTYDLNGTLTWTPETAKDDFIDASRQAYKCITNTALNFNIETVVPIERKRCSP
ncbi:multiheme c-type cytochrome [Pendulispora albinea]|uniref:Cytochrome c family protein n=1 Tax=Pendulispora albinea TaxID=2741071 RepID=A0ABZ2M626_9BACT